MIQNCYLESSNSLAFDLLVLLSRHHDGLLETSAYQLDESHLAIPRRFEFPQKQDSIEVSNIVICIGQYSDVENFINLRFCSVPFQK